MIFELSVLMAWLLIIVGGSLYCVIGVLFTSLLYKMEVRRDIWKNSEQVMPAFGGIAWPLLGPAFVVYLKTTHPLPGSRRSRSDRKHEKALAAARRKTELAAENAKAIEIMERSINGPA